MGARVWAVWLVGLAAYLVAVMHRTSFGVAGLDAAERFDAAPATLSGFVVLQLLVYATLQVPVGMMLDRFGARRLVAAGALTMAAGQLTLALATDLSLAIAARVLVGTGDALTFISVLAVVGAWFPPRRIPLISQLTGLLGQLGQILSAVPLAALLHGPGWTWAFVSAAALGLAVAVAVLAVLRDRPAGVPAPQAATSPRELFDGLRGSLAEPGTLLGAFTHMGTQFSTNVFALLWGVPYLVAGQGMTNGAASGLLTLLVLGGLVVGPLFGEVSGRRPDLRFWVVVAVISLNALAWTAVLLVPPPAPRWLLVLLVLALATGGPASMIGFDFARTFNPAHRRGTAVGVVNLGGFFASLLVAQALGLVLGAAGSAEEDYSPGAFRVAWTVQYAVWALTLTGVVVCWRKARRRSREDQPAAPPREPAAADQPAG